MANQIALSSNFSPSPSYSDQYLTPSDNSQVSSPARVNLYTMDQLAAISAKNHCNIVLIRRDNSHTQVDNSRNIIDSGNITSDRRYCRLNGSSSLSTRYLESTLEDEPSPIEGSSLLCDLGNFFYFIGRILRAIYQFFVWIGTIFINLIRG